MGSGNVKKAINETGILALCDDKLMADATLYWSGRGIEPDAELVAKHCLFLLYEKNWKHPDFQEWNKHFPLIKAKVIEKCRNYLNDKLSKEQTVE